MILEQDGAIADFQGDAIRIWGCRFPMSGLAACRAALAILDGSCPSENLTHC